MAVRYSFDQVVSEVRQLSWRMRSREEAADALLGQATKVHSKLLAMRQYQEQVASIGEISKRVVGRPRGDLVLCLAAENKELSQVRQENKILRESLAEYEAALEMIMSKYRGQVSRLLRAKQVEEIIQSVLTQPQPGMLQSRVQTDMQNGVAGVVTARLVNGVPEDHPTVPSATMRPASALKSAQTDQETSLSSKSNAMTERLLTLAAVARDVTDQGDAYEAELEEEIQRLRTENAGLREVLLISSTYCNINDSVIDEMGLVSLPSQTSAAHPISASSTITSISEKCRTAFSNFPLRREVQADDQPVSLAKYLDETSFTPLMSQLSSAMKVADRSDTERPLNAHPLFPVPLEDQVGGMSNPSSSSPSTSGRKIHMRDEPHSVPSDGSLRHTDEEKSAVVVNVPRTRNIFPNCTVRLNDHVEDKSNLASTVVGTELQ